MAAHRSYQRHRRKMNLCPRSFSPDILLSSDILFFPVSCHLLAPVG